MEDNSEIVKYHKWILAIERYSKGMAESKKNKTKTKDLK